MPTLQAQLEAANAELNQLRAAKSSPSGSRDSSSSELANAKAAVAAAERGRACAEASEAAVKQSWADALSLRSIAEANCRNLRATLAQKDTEAHLLQQETCKQHEQHQQELEGACADLQQMQQAKLQADAQAGFRASACTKLLDAYP